MTDVITCYDAAFIPPHEPSTAAVVDYFGGDTPNPVTVANINGWAARYRIPTWVRSDPSAVNPATDAAEMLARLAAFGVPKGVYTWLDLETAEDTVWVSDYGNLIHLGGYKVSPYGSLDSIGGNPILDGYVVADWTGVPHLPFINGRQALGCQYANSTFTGGPYDLSILTAGIPLWDTEAHPPVSPRPPVPIIKPPAPAPSEVNVNVPTLSETAPGPNVISAPVRNLQTLLIEHGFSCGPTGADGRFGGNTAAAVKACEEHYKLSIDAGIAGEQVWTALCNE